MARLHNKGEAFYVDSTLMTIFKYKITKINLFLLSIKLAQINSLHVSSDVFYG